MTNNFEINTNEYLQQCDSRDVLSFNNEKWIDIKKLLNIIYRSFISSGINSIIGYIANNSDFKDTRDTRTWFFEGQECEILKAGSQRWQKGKLKINVTLEFIPDQVEVEQSPLDDIRQAEINNIE